MEQVKILIVEDKVIVAEDLAAQLEQLGYCITGIAESGEEALVKFDEELPDLVLMDISLPGKLDGIQTASLMNRIHPLPFIYLTALSDGPTVERAMKTHPSAYLVKPYQARDLKIAIDLAWYNFTSQETSQEERTVLSKEENQYLLSDSLFLKCDHRFEKVSMDNILYFKAYGSYTDIFTEGRTYTLTKNLNQLSQLVSSPSFMRVHRSFVVNLKRISSFEVHRVMIGEQEIPVSKAYRKELAGKFRML